ncbi:MULTISPECIES: hypothetical protein [Parachlamydia]|jgi:hypothetical protein|uniref:hypothetical protein n=1 Tax=Parachlamydia TaxID=83551 RepID=UPI0001C177CC|nr:hypothetical protein [Parachlamydia acanthamoebae]EFB40418.1 hypothetical protein pah_c205o064 [Parachlamydia acanthamoebae str. Hall's coccus]
MMDIEKQFADLLTLTQLYVFQEHQLKDWTLAESQAFTYFKKRAQSQKEAKLSPKTAPINPSFTPLPIAATTPQAPPKKKPLLSAILAKEENKTTLAKESEASPAKTQAEWHLELPPTPTADSFEPFHAAFQKLFPARTLTTHIPDDAEARQKKELWKLPQSSPAVIILSFGEPSKLSLFLQNLAKAIEHLVPQPVEIRSAFSIEALNEWSALFQSQDLRLIIATDAGIQSCPQLIPFYRETQKQSRHYLDRIPLLLLSDLSLYLKEPKLKLSLWQVLCEMLKS